MSLKWITNNWLNKICAFILAVGLWYYVAGEESIETTLKIPVELELSKGMVAVKQSADTITVTLKARKDTINQIRDKASTCVIDLTYNADPKTVIVPIEKKNLPFVSNVDIVRITPERVEVNIDRLVQRVVPVRVPTEGTPAPGYEVQGFIIDPISALVKGPESFVKDLVYIDTDSIDVTGRQKTFRKTVQLKTAHMLGEKMPSQLIEVVVKIGEVQKTEKAKIKK